MGKKAKRNKRVASWKKNLDPFYNSKAWKELRERVIQHYGAKCMICGRTRKDGVQINVDHIRPRKLWPSLSLDFDNMGVLCGFHNKKKGNKNWGDYRLPEIAAKLMKPVEDSIGSLPRDQREHLRAIMLE